MKVTVVGSVNLDLVITANRLPQAGETLTDAQFARHPGGKGANQALAARLLGADVSLIAAVGGDPFATEALHLLRDQGVDLSRLVVFNDQPTGVAVIIVGKDGENQIVVAPGANRSLTAVGNVDCDLMMAQLEIPIETVVEAAESNGFFCLNAAPFRPVPTALLRRVDLLVVNEGEHQQLGEAVNECPNYVAVTHGKEGAALFEAGRELTRASAPPVEAVDATAAGDAFCAALAVSLAEGLTPDESLRFACAAGAVTASRRGAQPSLPTRAEVESLLQQ